MQCDDLHERLDAQRTGALDAVGRAELDAHLERCSTCRGLASRERAWAAFLVERLSAPDPAGEALRARVAAAVDAAARPPVVRIFGSRWAPRLAMAAVLAVVVLVPLVWMRGGGPGLAVAAAARHTAHEPTPDGSIPPCCTPLAIAVGDRIAAALGEARVPDLHGSGLDFAHAAHCTFGGDPVYSLEYRDGAGRRFSLYIGEQGAGEFKILRHETRDGVPQARHAVPPAGGEPGALRLLVVLWLHDGRLWSWVGPEGPAF